MPSWSFLKRDFALSWKYCGKIMFKVNLNQGTGDTPLALTIELIGYFSIDGDLQYRADLSQLKYYVPPLDLDNVNFDLDRNFASARLKPNSHIKLDYVLRWISDNFHRIEKPLAAQEERWLDIDFVCSRGVLKTILCTPYKKYGWIIRASKYQGTIYLCEFYTGDKELYQVNETLEEKQKTSRGYKFEQYMVADHPSHKPDPLVPLNTCEQFNCMFKTKFGNHSLLYKAEIDCISSQQPITDTLIGKTFEFIELKTFPMRNINKYNNIIPWKVIEWWSQNYWAEINKIVCGLKDTISTVSAIKEYPLHDLLKRSKPSCDTDKCKIFCDIFLDNVKRIVTEDYNKCMYKFYWEPSAKDIVNYNEEAPDNEKYLFLEPWFVDKAEEYMHAQQI